MMDDGIIASKTTRPMLSMEHGAWSMEERAKEVRSERKTTRPRDYRTAAESRERGAGSTESKRVIGES